ncbi:MAG: hypothetical protein LC792_05670 [Actinobacteria bacterium]|nr:hypothetical protein [Actinomycetota bacterium]
MTTRAEPWGVRHAAGLAMAVATGVALAVVAWYQASDEVLAADQVRWLSLGAGGAAVVLAGNGLWILTGRRALARRRADVLEMLRIAFDNVGARPAPASATVVTRQSGDPGYHHRRGCPMVVGRPVTVHEAGDPALTRSKPCGWCRPAL